MVKCLAALLILLSVNCTPGYELLNQRIPKDTTILVVDSAGNKYTITNLGAGNFDVKPIQ